MAAKNSKKRARRERARHDVVRTRSPRRRPRRPLVGFIGAGNMARSLVSGLLNNGWARSRLILSDSDDTARSTLERALGVKVYADNGKVAELADVLVLAIKPQVLRTVAIEIGPVVQQKRPLVISIAAGVRLTDIERWLGGNLAVARAMPNTPALVGSAASGLYANARVNPGMRNVAESILRAVGVTVWLQDESLLDVVTALSGSGPAYFFLVMEALEQAATRAGLDPATARLLTLETALGAAKMALANPEEPRMLRERVTSPGGTTERAVAALENGGLRPLFEQAIAAATTRARELGNILGKDT